LPRDAGRLLLDRADAIAVAVAVCRSCPVRFECLVANLVEPSRFRFSIRGGLGPAERRGLVDAVASSSAVEVARAAIG
jgi:hypothetical protein